MLPRHQDPILAIATAPGRAAVGMVRVSGKNLKPLVQALFGRQLPEREAMYLPFCDAAGIPIDRGLALYFAAPHSFTGEDVLELQGHGGPVVLQLLLARCLEAASQSDGSATGNTVLPDLRLATAGEFSERAFLNDKIDLTQAEAIADLIDASTEAAARSAAQSLSGAFSKEVHALREALTRLRMLVEATLDFPEEEIDFLQKADAHGQLERIQSALQTVFTRASQGALLREGIQVVIAGQPNAGKSSLLNALAGAERAIVTPIAGTTRDRVQETIQIEGVPIHVIDTAGLRASVDAVEIIGIERAWEAIATADMVLFLHDLTRTDEAGYQAADADIRANLVHRLPSGAPVLDVWNKADAVSGTARADGLTLSAKTGGGLDRLRQALLAAAGWQAPAGGSFIARERHIQALRRVEAHCREAALHLASRAQALDLLAEELRLAQGALGDITGEFSSDDLLGVIFSQFCIGK
jgi:tRNA modification GTPase